MVVFFNTWFSALANTVKTFKDRGITVIGANISADCTYSQMVDNFYTEPIKESSMEWLNWALDICKKNNVDVFFPKYYAAVASKNAARFREIGTQVAVEKPYVLSEFDSKKFVYEKLRVNRYGWIPEYSVTSSSLAFKKYCAYWANQGYNIICKLDKDEGASSFRIIDSNPLLVEGLKHKIEDTVSVDDMLVTFRGIEKEGKKIMMMPFLDGPEISVDCYMSKHKGFIAIPRYKIGGRVKEIRLDPLIIRDCQELQKIFGFESIYNVQYRWFEGKPKLLEINPRMSGGIHLGAMTGFCLPLEQAYELSGQVSPQSLKDIKEYRVTQYEYPVML